MNIYFDSAEIMNKLWENSREYPKYQIRSNAIQSNEEDVGSDIGYSRKTDTRDSKETDKAPAKNFMVRKRTVVNKKVLTIIRRRRKRRCVNEYTSQKQSNTLSNVRFAFNK